MSELVIVRRLPVLTATPMLCSFQCPQMQPDWVYKCKAFRQRLHLSESEDVGYLKRLDACLAEALPT